MKRSMSSGTASSRRRSGPSPAVRPFSPSYHPYQQRRILMDTTPPLVTKLIRILEEQLKKLRKPMRAFLTALNALFGPPPGPPRPTRPPVKKFPPKPGETPPPGVPDARPKPPLPTGGRPPGAPRPGMGVTDRDARVISTVLGTDIQSGERVTISLKERYMGLYIPGATGTWKTTLDLNMILSDIRLNRGLCLLEPHGDLVRNVLAAMPEERLK